MGNTFYDGVERQGTACIKWDFQKENFGRDGLLPFSIADSDYPTCPQVIEALRKRVGQGAFGYTDLDAAYFSAVKRWFETRHQWEIEQDWITTTSGIMPAISAAIAALTTEHAKILVQPPVYDPFYAVIRGNGRIPCENHLLKSESGAYSMDFDDLERQLKEGAEMLLLCSPHNPVGRVWTAEELQRTAELCRKYGTVLVSDEIHWDILPGARPHISAGTLAAPGDKLMVCTAPSKTFNLAGLQTSNIIIPQPELRARFQQWLFSRHMFCANALGLEACRAAYEFGGEWVDAQNRYLKENADIAAAFFKEKIPQARLAELQGTYLLWIDLTFLGRGSDELIQKIAERGAGLNNGRHYGDRYDGFVRMNIACPRKQLLDGLECVLQAVDALR